MASIVATSIGSDKSKRSFEFRMCKKVAELTQVVHMLFTRNHEKEVEMEALKEAYEFEICEVITDAKTRLAQMQQQQEDMLKQRTGDTDRIRKLLEGELLSKEQEWRRKLEESDKHLQEERTECQNLRDMLIRAQLDIENLRQGVSDQITSQTGEIATRDREIERLNKQVQHLEETLKIQDQESSEALKDLEQAKEKLEHELRHAQGLLEESHKTRDQLLMRNKQLEAEMKALKRDFHRKVADMVKAQMGGHKNGSSLSQNEELERLRREIQRYRLELSNRDVTFNRMFTDQQPVYLDRSAGTGLVKLHNSHSAGTVHPSTNGTNGNHPGILKSREKTLTGPVSGPVLCFQEQEPSPAVPPAERQRAMSTPSNHFDARDSRFPSIRASPDIKPRPQDPKSRPPESKSRASSSSKLSKPRTLPKEMLFTK